MLPDGRLSGERLLIQKVQIEYLVVTYKDDDELVTLSLRQADILQALAQDEELGINGGRVTPLQDNDGQK